MRRLVVSLLWICTSSYTNCKLSVQKQVKWAYYPKTNSCLGSLILYVLTNKDYNKFKLFSSARPNSIIDHDLKTDHDPR